MERYDRTRLIIEYGAQQAIEWGTHLQNKYEITVIIPPRLGLTMIKQRETARNTLFYLGEVLVTETKVRLNHQIGIGIVTGDQFDLATALAVIDVVYKNKMTECLELDSWLERLVKVEKDSLKAKNERYGRTKVDFSTMNLS